jgi:voltage-gated potassium channel
MLHFKQYVFSVLETDAYKTLVGKIVNTTIITLIILNVIGLILHTVPEYADAYVLEFYILEISSTILFSIEYLARIWVSNLKRPYKEPIKGRLKYIFSPMALVDLFSILPYFIVLFTALDLRFLTIIRFSRLLRIFKLRRYSSAIHMLFKVVEDKKEELVITFGTIVVLLIFSSSFMYIIEHDAQPEKFSSIPATMWWSVMTLTTVGYGDMIPITPTGKILSAFIAMLGIAMFALPAAMLSSGFTEQIQLKRKRKKKYICPHCNHEIDGQHLHN